MLRFKNTHVSRRRKPCSSELFQQVRVPGLDSELVVVNPSCLQEKVCVRDRAGK